MANELVLIIDDSAQTVDFLLEYVLEPHGYRTLIARDGEAGFNMALEKHPDLILLDMRMSKMSGMEVLDALSAEKIKVPVIMMTFHGSENLAVQAFRMGAKDYILKPFTVSEMIDSIERALTEVRLRRERDALTQRLMKTNRDLENRVRELNTLFGIGKSVTSVLDQAKLLSRLVEAAIYLTNAETGSLMLVDHITDELYMVAARGLDERVVRSFRLKVDDNLAGGVIQSGQALILTSNDLTKIKTSYLVRSLMYVPLKAKGQIRGILSVDNRQQNRDFTNHDLRLLSALADYAAISLENAQLFSQAESERTKLATVLSEIEEPVIVVSRPENFVVVSNAAFCRTMGLNTANIEGQPLAELIDNESLLRFISPDSINHRKGEIPLDDGRTFYATQTSIPKVGRVIIMQDVTHFKELDRMKSDFVATVSHDLRAPLTSITEYAEMIATVGNLNERQKLFVDRIRAGSSHITTLIDNLLDLNSIELELDPDSTVVDLSQIATELVTEYQHQAGRKRQQLIYHTITARPAMVLGNEFRLKQAVGNLLDNALRFTPKDGQISAIVQAENKQVTFKVEDNGPGISSTDLPFVFDKFFRANRSDQTKSEGIGLGLAICKSIVEKSGGHIWAESQPDHGSVFTFTLPLDSDGESDSVNSHTLSPETLAA